MTRIRVLRNRIAHHEPIVHWELFDAHERMLLLTRWLSPAAADWCERHSRFRTEFAHLEAPCARSAKAAEASERDAIPLPV